MKPRSIILGLLTPKLGEEAFSLGLLFTLVVIQSHVFEAFFGRGWLVLEFTLGESWYSRRVETLAAEVGWLDYGGAGGDVLGEG